MCLPALSLHIPLGSRPCSSAAIPSAISACARGGEWRRALQLMGLMREAGVPANTITYSSAISACGKGLQWRRALQLLHEMQQEGLSADLIVMNAAISACARCGDRAAAKTKQMSLSRAPPTLVMHLKRFRRGAKIDRHVAFPFSLDVAPYAASAAERARVAFGDRVERRARGGPEEPEERTSDRSSAEDEKERALARVGDVNADVNVRSAYELFAVVVHSGGMESGHYICYVKCQNAWFRCDDHRVSRADPVVVAAAQAYLLFYHAV